MSPENRQANKQQEAAPLSDDTSATDEGVPEDPERLRDEIAETREELGETVEALAQKADVKAQAKEKVAERKEQLKEKQEQAKAKVSELGGKVGGATPEQAKEGAAQVAERARERPIPVAAGGAFAAGVFVGWLMGRR